MSDIPPRRIRPIPVIVFARDNKGPPTLDIYPPVQGGERATQRALNQLAVRRHIQLAGLLLISTYRTVCMISDIH